MRQLLLFILFSGIAICPNTAILAQDSAKAVITKNIADILISAHVLLSDEQKACTSNCFLKGCKWDNNAGKRDKYLKLNDRLQYELLKNFQPPVFCKDNVVVQNLTFNNKSLTYLGSYIIRNNNYDNIGLNPTPDLPILATDNQLQMSMPNPTDYSSHFIVDYTTDNSFNSAVNVDMGGGFGDYFNSKNNEKNNISRDIKRQTSLATGTFINNLGLVAEDFNNGQATADELTILYDLWLKNADGTIKPGDSVIYSFDGMCIYSTSESKYSSTNNVSVTAAGGVTLPGFNVSAKGSAQWGYSKNITTALKTYDIYMFRKPKLVKVPLPDDINRNWKKLSNYSTNPVDLSKGDLLSSSKPLIIPIKFGPIPAITDIFHTIRLDEDYVYKNIVIKVDNQISSTVALDPHNFIRHIALVTDDQSRIKPSTQNDGCYWFDLEIYRNDDYLNTFVSAGQQISLTIPLKVYFDLPNLGVRAGDPQYLTKTYDAFSIRTELTPTPYVNTYNIVPTKDATSNSYIYSIMFYFDKSQTLTISSVPRQPSISDVFGLPASVDQSLGNLIKNTSRIKSVIDASGGSSYQLTFNIPVENNYFNNNFPLYNIGLGISFYAKNLLDNSNPAYKRLLLIGLNQPEQSIVKTDTTKPDVILKNNQALVNSLNATAVLQNGQTVGQLLSANTKDSKLNVLSFIDDFKKLSNTSVTNSTYVVDKKFVNKSAQQ